MNDFRDDKEEYADFELYKKKSTPMNKLKILKSLANDESEETKNDNLDEKIDDFSNM